MSSFDLRINQSIRKTNNIFKQSVSIKMLIFSNRLYNFSKLPNYLYYFALILQVMEIMNQNNKDYVNASN